jgi:hypothetical protein
LYDCPLGWFLRCPLRLGCGGSQNSPLGILQRCPTGCFPGCPPGWP